MNSPESKIKDMMLLTKITIQIAYYRAASHYRGCCICVISFYPHKKECSELVLPLLPFNGVGVCGSKRLAYDAHSPNKW